LSQALIVSEEFDYTEIENVIRKKKLRIEEILIGFTKNLNRLEYGKDEINDYEILTDIEDLRLLVFLTSPIDLADLKRERHQLIPKTNEKDEKVECQIANTLITLEFDEIDSAKVRYKELHAYYTQCDDAEKRKRYQDVQRLYDLINYGDQLE